MIFGVCSVLQLCGCLLRYETVSTVSFDVCALIYFLLVFTLPKPLLNAFTTACSTAAAPSFVSGVPGVEPGYVGDNRVDNRVHPAYISYNPGRD